MHSWKDAIRKVEPYIPGEQPKDPDVIKLNTNENPYPPAPGVQEVLRTMDAASLRLYPDPQTGALVKAIAKEEGLSPGQVFVGVGSDDVLAMAFLTFFCSDRPVLFPDVTYSFYKVWAECFRIPYRTVPLTEDWRIDPEDYKEENGGIIFPNPNAPTSLAMSLLEVRQILEANPGSVVIVDEAYVDFGAETAATLLPEFENLLVVRTFSKSRSMAGMRIGYALGGEEMIRCLSDVRASINSYTMNLPAQQAGVAAIKDRAYFENCIEKIRNTRDSVRDELEEMGFTCMDSMTNFLFVTHPEIPAAELYERLLEKKIYVRYFAQPRIDNWIRITIGSRGQMQVFLDTLRHIFHKRNGHT